MISCLIDLRFAYQFDYGTEVLEKQTQDAEAIVTTDLATCSREEVVAAVRESVRIQRELEAFQARAAARIDDDGVFADAPFHARTAKDLLERYCGMSSREANQRVTVARVLPHLPVAASEWAAGEIGIDHVAAIGRVVNPQTIGTLRQDEAVMVGWATSMPYRKFAGRIADWAADIDPEKHDAALAPSTLSLTRGAKGRGVLTGDLSPADHSQLSALLVETEGQLRRQEDTDRKAGITIPESTYAERLAQAFMLITTRALNGPSDQIFGAARASIALLVTPEQLAAGTGALDVELGEPVGADHFSGLCCDAEIYRTVMSIDGEILDVGRTFRTATAPQRRAVVARDRTCVIPHCDAPPRWCQVHHVIWWRHGGTTTIENLVLVCGRHHTQIHSAKIRILADPDHPQHFRFENEHGEELRRPDLETDRHTQAA